MTTPQQSAVERQEKIRGFNQRLVKEASLFLISSNLSAVGFFFFALSLSERYSNFFSPETQIGSGVIFFGGLAVGLIGAARMLKIRREAMEAHLSTPRGGNMAEIIKPLAVRLSADEKKALADSQARITPPLLVSGIPDMETMVLETVPDDGSSLSTVTKEREAALYFIATRLLDQAVIGADGLSCVERTKILRALTDILAPAPTSLGLTLTGRERNFLNAVVMMGAVTEKAPEVMSAYLRLLRKEIESYIPNKRIPPAGQDAVNTLLSQAIQAERLAGCSVSPPIGLWIEAQRLKKEEKERVILTEEQLIDMAKSVTALANSRIPEVRKTYVEVFPYIIELLSNEKKRLEGLKEKDTDSLAAINTVLFILQITINDLVDRQTIAQINQLCGERLAKIRKITPRVLIDELETTGFGSLTKEGDTIMIRAKNTVLADVLACAAAICDPITPWIEVYVGMDDDRPVQSAVISTAVFYSQRLILKDRRYISSQLKEQSAPVEAVLPSPEPVLLANVSQQPAS